MHRWVALVALAACEPSEPTRDAPVVWVNPPGPSGFPLGAIGGRLGRSQAPQPVVDLGITSAAGALAPLHLATAFAVPGDGPARAAMFGWEDGRPAIDLVDVDRGRIEWRDRALCAAPIAGVTGEAIVCADEAGTRAIGLDGAPRWHTRSRFVAFTAGRVVAGDGEVAVVIDAARGDERARIRVPGLPASAVIASCGDAGRELYAVGEDGRLVRIADAPEGPVVRWAAPLGAILAIDACDAATVLVSESGAAGPALVAIARATGKVTGRVDGVRGAWPARDGSERIEVATAVGIASYPRDLAGPAVQLGGPAVGELIASRGEHRLVRATPSTAVLLDRAGVRAYLPLAALGAVLGDAALIATSWIGSPGETAHRLALPPRWRRALRLPALHRGVALDAELRDLPPVRPLEVAAAAALPDTGMRGVVAQAIDPADGAAVYAAAVDRDGEGAAVARADLAAGRWRWQRIDGCGPGAPIALAVARDVVVCGARGRPATVRATSRDGVLVALEDGDAYRIDARSAAVVALPGLGLGWHAAGDLVTGQTLGGPIPGPAPPVPAPTLAQLLRRPLQILHAEIDTPPPMSTPIQPPPPLGDSWQLTLYELGGGLRARNDYALPAPVGPPALRGPPGSPLIVAYGPGQREVCVLDPRTGDPLRRVALPDDAVGVFGTVIDGSPVAGALLAAPLRVVRF